MPQTIRNLGPWLDKVLRLSGYALLTGLALLSARWFQVLQVPTFVGLTITLVGVAGVAVWYFSIIRARNQVLRDYEKIQSEAGGLSRRVQGGDRK